MEQPAVSASANASPRPATRSGCMKWGLIGCGVLSALLIVGVVAVMLKARDLMEALLQKTESNVLTAATPEVGQADREAFRAAFRDFTAQAKEQKVTTDRMMAVQGKVTRALSDQKVTPAEIREITEAARPPAVTAPPAK